MAKNVRRNRGFEQVCVWHNFVIGPNGVFGFRAFMLKEFGVRVQYLEEIITAPHIDCHGNPVLGTGGRNDLFFAVHKHDVEKFAYRRLRAGIRWVEDVLSLINYRQNIYPTRVFAYKTWEATPTLGKFYSGAIVPCQQIPNHKNPS